MHHDLFQDIRREGSGFLDGDVLTVACDIDVHADACPIFEGLLGIHHCMHDVALVVDGQKVYANKAVSGRHKNTQKTNKRLR